jgi:DNA-binding response OmpR family regulator
VVSDSPVVADDETIKRLLRNYLRTHGYEALSASGGEEGLDMAVREGPDLVVLDIMMPGMDGWEVCRHRRAVSEVPIIVLTAKTMPHAELLTQVWGKEYAGDTDVLSVYIRYLRQKIEDNPAKPTYVRTEWGIGYRFDPAT